jgi:uncharacterized protein (DUF1697 family)
MQKYIALFRGINVGGNNILPMKELITLLENLGAEKVATYIQSGNVVLTHKENNLKILSEKITAAIKKNFGFETKVLLLKQKEIEHAISSNPFPEGEKEPKTLHAFFLTTTPKEPDLNKMDEIKTKSEQYRLIGNIYYLHAPEGIGRSKLVSQVEKLLGVPVTGRNWRTVIKILDMIKENK